jgi:2-methylisocitrate lyase-like PEP mutase family enzyme
VSETIRQAVAVGLVGGSIEDATGNPRLPILEFAHAVDRVVAAAETAVASKLFLTHTARTERTNDSSG